MSERSLRRATLGLFALAVVVRLFAAAALGDGLYFSDEADYVDAADRLVAQHGFEADYARVPAYPILVAAFRVVAPGHLAVARGLQGVVGALGVLLLVPFGAATFGPTAAVIAGLLYALDPMFAMSGVLLYPEGPTAVLLLVVVVAAVRAAREGGTRAAWLAGVGLGVLAQLRPVGLVLLPAIAGWLALVGRRGAPVAGVVLGCLLALAPWTVRNYLIHGALEPIAIAGREAAPVDKSELRAHGMVGSLVAEAWKEPTAFLSHLTRELGHFFELYPQRLATDNPDRRAALHADDTRLPLGTAVPPRARDVVSAITFAPELALAIFGLVVGGRDRRRVVLLLAGVVLAYGLGYAIFVGKLRYRLPILPMLFLLAGHGAATLVSRRPDPA